jgi:hypothetical protein
MPFSAKKTKGFNLDCVLGNVSVTIVTCCGFVFQGTIEDDDNTRAQYGYPVVFPTMTMDYGNECNKPEDKECENKDEKKEHCPKPIEVDVDVKCDNEPKFICLRLTAIPGNICCPTFDGLALTSPNSLVTAIFGTGATVATLFDINDTVLIKVTDIVAIGPSRVALAE